MEAIVWILIPGGLYILSEENFGTVSDWRY